jgi:L,D-peptidoglycan transpeptidase YkuD (ErfK/YbiS/YcfS/YnhG family)
MRVILALVIACAVGAASASDVRSHGAQQLVLVLISGWDATQGTLRSFEWKQERWVKRGRDVPISIGRTGAAWGIGLHETQLGLQKREGDGRSPAGIFSIGRAFGYATSVQSQLPYDAMTQFDYCIDVNESPLYNQIVDARKVGSDAVAKSTEPMRRDIHAKGDQRYKLGFVIEHNPQHVTARGSCIFAHLWASAGQVTAGCTAMEEAAMRELIAWLDGDSKPVFVLLPQAEYERLKASWHLPSIERAL